MSKLAKGLLKNVGKIAGATGLCGVIGADTNIDIYNEAPIGVGDINKAVRENKELNSKIQKISEILEMSYNDILTLKNDIRKIIEG